MKTTAIVPIKLNNERLPGKNIKMLGDRPLIQYILGTLTSIHDIDEIYVYCSSNSICKYLSGKIKFLKRKKELDLPSSNFNQIFDAFISVVDSDIYIYAHATAPFITAETVIDCLDKVKNGSYASAFTANKIQDYLWADGKPLNFDATNLPRSQDLKPIYRETSGIYVFTKEEYLKHRRRIGDNPYIKEVSYKEAVDINTSEDFELAQQILTCKNI
jgi:CMP-N-acetylneuraminic acid synthetase